MPKIFIDKNVYDVAMERYEIIFNQFDNVYISVSGGKDSSITVQLAAIKARELGKKFSVLYIDLEAQYTATIQHVEELIEEISDVLEDWYWIAMPLSLRNAVSVLQPKWICWDKNDKYKWVRPLPKNKYVIHEDNYPVEWTWFKRGMEFEEFILYFAKWFNEKNGGISAAGIGIRSNESLNRFRTIISESKEKYKEYNWTTRVVMGQHPINTYNFYPIYDWTTEDDWIAVSKFDLKFNYIYELMYKNGVSIHEQRLCQPYGDDQRNGLDQFRSLEPETWEKVLNRVHGANFGNIYCRTSLLGNLKSEKPDGMTWEQYSVFLLESLGLYAPELRDHYYKKIRTFLNWWEKEAGISVGNMPDDKWDIEGFRQAPYWKRIARAIERNDFWMKRLSFGQTKRDVEKLFELKKKYKNIIYGNDTNDKHLKEVAETMNKEQAISIKKYVGDYDRAEFYSIMGKFFAEKEYKKELPYIQNNDAKEWWLLYNDNNDLCGFCSTEKQKEYVNIGNVYVLHEFREKGLCRKIMEEILKEYSDKVVRFTSNNTILLNVLNAFGFKEISQRGSYKIMERTAL